MTVRPESAITEGPIPSRERTGCIHKRGNDVYGFELISRTPRATSHLRVGFLLLPWSPLSVLKTRKVPAC
ncbi:hypothetical protein SERLA73DRAFT_146365, partial [Serpula lacrymans var. lacrymans S7.3]